ncbi:MAG TPA: AraC family transcriptional regulator [Nocardioidaceae bacterium]|jgi:AraC-like DNA-binding protein
MATPRGYPGAIVRPRSAEQALRVDRRAPGQALADYVDYHWFVGWDVEEPYRQQVVPQPRIHLAAEEGRLLVHGVSRAPFHRTLTGRGHTLGVSFLPGMFRGFLGAGVGRLSGRVVPAGDLLGAPDAPTAERILSTDSVDVMVAAMEEYLTPLRPREADPVAHRVRRLVETAQQDRSITRAETLAGRGGLSLRTLQRLFTEYVGIGPKWVIQRFRILEAAEVAATGERVDWAALAYELGFSDQAHLTRVFTQIVGTPPATYRRNL